MSYQLNDNDLAIVESVCHGVTAEELPRIAKIHSDLLQNARSREVSLQSELRGVERVIALRSRCLEVLGVS